MKAVFDQEYVKRINGPHVKTGKTKMDNALALIDDIEQWIGPKTRKILAASEGRLQTQN